MTSNKRIHELLEWVKSKKTRTIRDCLNKAFIDEVGREGLAMMVEPVYGEPYEVTDPMYEILQHLLEVDIDNSKGRKYCSKHNEDYKDCWGECHGINYQHAYACPSCYLEEDLRDFAERDEEPHPDLVYMHKKPALSYKIHS